MLKPSPFDGYGAGDDGQVRAGGGRIAPITAQRPLPPTPTGIRASAAERGCRQDRCICGAKNNAAIWGRTRGPEITAPARWRRSHMIQGAAGSGP